MAGGDEWVALFAGRAEVSSDLASAMALLEKHAILRVEGVENRDLRDVIARSFQGVGVGYYPNSSFIHVDIRERRAAWIDYAGPGQSACYASDVSGDLADGSAETLSYAQAKARGCK